MFRPDRAMQFNFDPDQPRDDKGLWRTVVGADTVTVTLQNGEPLTEQMLHDSRQAFLTLAIPPMFSGFKAHVYCETAEEVMDVATRIAPLLSPDGLEPGWGAKVSTDAFFELTADRDHPQHGKGVTVYFDNYDTWQQDLAKLVEINSTRFERSTRAIIGEEYAGEGVSYRFELGEDVGRSVDYMEYRRLYKAAFAILGYEFTFNPDQPRDEKGRWRETPGGPVSEFWSTTVKGSLGTEIEVDVEDFSFAYPDGKYPSYDGIRNVRAVAKAWTKSGEPVVVIVTGDTESQLADMGVAQIGAAVAQVYDTAGHPWGHPPTVIVEGDSAVRAAAGPDGPDSFIAAYVDSLYPTHIRVNEWIGDVEDMDHLKSSYRKQMMPTFDSSTAVEYILAHEYGHTHDFWLRTEGPKQGDQRFLNDVAYSVKDGMSSYGRSHFTEGYAEAYAEWVLSFGVSDNPSAVRYATMFGWELP